MLEKREFRATTLVCANFLSILQEKTYFFYFTHPLLQNTNISLSILHIYSIKYSFFLHFLLFPSLSSLEVSHRPNTNPKSPTPSHCLLRQATDPTQTQNHPHPATVFSVKLQTQHKPKITHTQPPTTINDQIEQTRRNHWRSLLWRSLWHHISGCKTCHQLEQYPSKPTINLNNTPDQYPRINTQLLSLPPNPHIMSLRAPPWRRFWF